MTEHLRGNRLLLTLVIVYAAYIVVGIFTPRPYMSSIVGIVATMAGVFMFSRYAGKAWDIIWKRERAKYGAHDAILGAAEMALGIVYSGLFRIAWNWYGQPESWQATWFSSLGLFMIAKGAFRIAVSPNEDLLPHRMTEGVWTIIMWLFVVMTAYVAGATFGG